ncbi:hypothetical protein RRG08_039141 [Elysia crispata]|uniref:Peptidase M13 C-terminal domain-containing protein n=1 Tax=Elysia crispata TaxID=231223 RepID=A0AAE0YMQ2_9GAST|nr:hypothetical protein RRG08_039141 [Elysia crispata]
MRLRISHPEKGFGEDALDNDPDLMNITEDNYYKNVVLCMIRDYRQELRNLGKTPGKSWNPRFPPNRVNAFYHPQENTIYVLAGILQQPMFSSRNLLAHNYGAIGSLIGHEIIHGFDATGSQFDSHGNLRNWWEDEDKERFQNATQCFIDQYNNYTYPQLKGKTYVKQNATNSVGEIVADSCGIKQSYHAYRKLVSQVGEEEKLLSGLGLSPDQLFFVGYAQAWCSKETNAALIARLLSRSHPHATYRILSTLWNFPEFSQTFNCSLGSPMNPERKCSLFGD